MEEKVILFFLKEIDLFERILINMWKSAIEIQDRSILSGDKKFMINFKLKNEQNIRLEGNFDLDETGQIIRAGIVYKLYEKDEIIRYLALSILYECPYDLELCNLYGLYTKKDALEMDQIKEQKKIRQYQTNRNLLKENQFYIFNMKRIQEHCQDPLLDQLLQELHQTFQKWNQSSK